MNSKVNVVLFALVLQTQRLWGFSSDANVKLPFYLQLDEEDTVDLKINLDNVLELYRAAKAGNSKQLLEACFSFIDNNAVDVMKLDNFLKFSLQDIKIILSHKTLKATEIDKYNFVAKLIKSELASDVKRELMTLVDLNKTVEINLDNVLEFYVQAKVFSAEKLLQTCLSFIENNFVQVLKLDVLYKLPVDDFVKILSRQTLKVKEISKFIAVEKFIRNDTEANVKQKLLALIDLNNMSGQDLLNIVLPSGLYATDAVINEWRKQKQNNSISTQNEIHNLRQELRDANNTIQSLISKLTSNAEKTDSLLKSELKNKEIPCVTHALQFQQITRRLVTE
jgi:hypothetical protein